MTAKRRDTRHKEIREALESIGVVVCDTADCGHGMCDMVAIRPNGSVVLIEVKSEGGKFTEDECKFMLKLVHPVYRVITTPEQAIEVLQNAP